MLSPPARADDELDFLPGLVVQLEAGADEPIVRVDREVRIDRSSLAGDPRVVGPLHLATWSGYLMSQNTGPYRLAAYGSGTIHVQLAGAEILNGEIETSSWLVSDAIPLSFDWHRLEVQFKPSADEAALSLYWTGPGFSWEPLGHRQLYHDPESTVDDSFRRGELLARALRCQACHAETPSPAVISNALWKEDRNEAAGNVDSHHPNHPAPPLPAPALDQLANHLHSDWLLEWLTLPASSRAFSPASSSTPGQMPDDDSDLIPREEDPEGAETSDRPSSLSHPPSSQFDAIRSGQRRMPYFALSESEQEGLRQYLLGRPDEPSAETEQGGSQDDGVEPSPEVTAELLEQGQTLMLSLGCLACHAYESLGTAGLFQGGDLTWIGDKRPEAFFAQWLRTPHELNVHHRMPVYDLTDEELSAVTQFLASLKREAKPRRLDRDASSRPDAKEESEKTAEWKVGVRAFQQYRCGACHEGPSVESAAPGHEIPSLQGLTADSDWKRGCSASNAPSQLQPAYGLSPDEQEALQVYYSSRSTSNPSRDGTSARARDHEPELAPTGNRTQEADETQDAEAADGKGVPENSSGTRSSFASLSLEQQLLEYNCVACHGREEHEGLSSRLQELVQQQPRFAEQLPVLTPPSLNSVGDKLHDEALRAVLSGRASVHRPWLQVRMPKFPLSEVELEQLASALIQSDRIPSGLPSATENLRSASPEQERANSEEVESVNPEEEVERITAADGSLEIAPHIGARLVTADGFGCLSCHAVGRVRPPQGPLNTLGPNLAMLEQRIRRPWFDRWVRNPARIIPRMEMPSVQTPVPGVLNDDLDRQLSAVWATLNELNFRPPEPNPVRTLRLSGRGADTADERAVFVTEVTKVGEATYIKPLVMGLPNRQNLLLDLEENRLAHWWLGDAARQRTVGKTWFWEPGNPDLTSLGDVSAEWQLRLDGQVLSPRKQGQFVTDLDELRHLDGGIQINHRLHFAREDRQILLHVRQRFLGPVGESFWVREFEVEGIPEEGELLLNLVGSEAVRGIESVNSSDQNKRRLRLNQDPGIWLDLLDEEEGSGTVAPEVAWEEGGTVVVPGTRGQAVTVKVAYGSDISVDTFPPLEPDVVPTMVETLQVVPGFLGTRLPLPREIMPSALAWDQEGNPIIASLKGRVWRALDRDGDGIEETLQLITDGLAAPYGLSVDGQSIDVVTRSSLFRLQDDLGDGFADRVTTLYSGWGHTDDYHDWTVGLPRDSAGNYYVSIPCQQDNRSVAAARMRGTVARLIPRRPTLDNPHQFMAEVISIGHRFPMGIARNRAGELFTTDNQGNYKPFNQLNHVRPDTDFGFINAIDRPTADQRPPAEPAAVDIPHPWTRSVNGICFLETPTSSAGAAGADLPSDQESTENHRFGPFEGHLVGCEYDTRRLIRMSLQRVGDEYQGAAYPFSLYEPIDGPTFLGPLVCQVSPQGDLYIGCIRDSGWGGANNIGGVVRLTWDPESLPPGIAEMRATDSGFEILFTQPVPSELAGDRANYSLSSYRRVATPAYGGSDQDRRQERIRGVTMDPSGSRVTLQLDELREGFVYELHVRNLAGAGELFFPAEAHYTLRRLVRP